MKPGAVLALVAVLLLTGCAAAPGPAGATGTGGAIRVVASTDVWGDIATRIGGAHVRVDSIIDDAAKDPHEYQATVRDQLAVSRAQLVIVNGGGYDDFLTRLLGNAPASTRTLDAVTASGLAAPAGEELNEHVWYDLPAVSKVAGAIADELARVEPGQEAVFQRNLAAFRRAVTALEGEEAAIARTASGEGVAITEPVPLHMTAALGLVNRTPQAFSEAIEEGDDVAPAVLQQQLALLRGRRVAVLAVNEQTVDATTTQVVDAAEAAGVPVVGVRETLPAGRTYLEWMRDDLAAFRAAVA